MIFSIAPAIAPIIGGWLLGFGRWPLIFWFLVAFSLVLLVVTWIWLPETHPPEHRVSLSPHRLLRDYAAIFTNSRFQRIAAAGAFNFSALFLYVASTPVFVVDVLGLNERQFGWFFVPMISGMMIGSWVAGRAAGRITGTRLVNIGFACSGVAMAANVAYNLLVDQPAIPWAVMPAMLNAFGIALTFPILTLAILDMYPRQRGSASSLQAFTGLVLNAAVAGLLSPLVSHQPLLLAATSAGFMLVGWVFWRWELARSPRPPACPKNAAAMEPTDQM